MYQRIGARLIKDRNALLQTAAIVIASLIPLIASVDKPYHLDDTLFIYTARQIIRSPLDPFGFSVNWEGTSKPMWLETKNPPLVSYYIALIIRVWGERETVLHLSFMPFMLLFLLGAWLLARRFTKMPYAATWLVLATPAVLVSASSVMADIPALGVFLLSLYLFISGYDNGKQGRIILSGILAGASFLMKYSGIMLPILFVAYHCVKREHRRYILAVVIPAAVIIGWHIITVKLYGHSHVGLSSRFSIDVKCVTKPWIAQSIALLTFLSGCTVFPVVFVRPFVANMRRPLFVAGQIVVALAASFAVFAGAQYTFGQSALVFVFSLASIAVCVSAASGAYTAFGRIYRGSDDERGRANSDDLFIFVWFFATVAFVYFVSWSVAARFILLILPSLSLVTIRLFERSGTRMVRLIAAGVVCSYLVGVIVLSQDIAMAKSFRSYANYVSEELRLPRERTYFLMDWGFKYYLENMGYRGLDKNTTAVKAGDYLSTFLLTSDEVIQRFIRERRVGMQELFGFQMGPRTELELIALEEKRGVIPLAITNRRIHAGFHSSVHGLLPYVFSTNPLVTLTVWRVL